MTEAPAASLPVMRAPSEGVPAVTDTEAALLDAVDSLGSVDSPVAIDTERAQGFRYDPSARLVQIKRDGAGIFLIDTMALPDLSALSAVLDAPWIFHAPGGDLGPLADLGMIPSSIFDTEIAARLVGVESFSLRGVCESTLGVSLDKSHQNEDWSLRPLPRDWLRYAALDVELLAPLREALSHSLEALGRLEWAEEEFAHELAHPPVPKANIWENMKGLSKLNRPQQLAIARELWNTRERIAQELDLAPTRVLGTTGIIKAALLAPQTRRSLQGIHEFRHSKARPHQEAWWSAVQRGANTPPDQLPSRASRSNHEDPPPARHWKRLDPEAFQRLQQVRQAVANAAKPLDISPDIVLEPRVQREIAWIPSPDIESALLAAGARPWQVKLVLPHL